MHTPAELRYSTDHEWVRMEGALARVGISDFAQDALGDVVYVELPEVGLEVSANSAFAEIESTKSVSDVIAPVSGEVLEGNKAAQRSYRGLGFEGYQLVPEMGRAMFWEKPL